MPIPTSFHDTVGKRANEKGEKTKQGKKEEKCHSVPKLLPCGFGEPEKNLKEGGLIPRDES